jgi:hypothetical protein
MDCVRHANMFVGIAQGEACLVDYIIYTDDVYARLMK